MEDFRFLTLAQVGPLARGAVTVRPSVLYAAAPFFISALIFFGMAGYWGANRFREYFPEHIQDILHLHPVHYGPFEIMILGTVFLFLLMARKIFKKACNSEAWLLKATPDGVLIQMRSYLNLQNNIEDETVVFIPSHCIAWVRKFEETCKGNDNEPYVFKALQIQTQKCETGELSRRLAEERKFRADGWRWVDFPVSLAEDGVLTVSWAYGMRPELDGFLKNMRRWYAVEASKQDSSTILETLKGAFSSPVYSEDDIRKAVQAGRTIEAIKMIRTSKKCGLRDAKAFVENLDKNL